ncbi:MAG TPA: extracellular solute-binding protein [Candidatus Limnocylindria bacterium]|nr:extracellular solute-binding protein [Candidatus Limnocylindria bacterium]
MPARLASLIVAASLGLAACGGEAAPPTDGTSPPGDGGNGGDGEGLIFWSAEDNAERIQATQAIIDRFVDETGIEVELVAIAEGDLATQVTAAVAGDTLPDVFGALSLGFTHGLAADGLADVEANAAVVDALGRETFSEAALDLVGTADGVAGVPSDSWAQLLVYRTDLFEEAGLEPPTTFDTIREAAETLNTGDQAGIVLGTGGPEPGFVQQTFEYFAVANGCDVVDDSGNVTIGSPECVETFQFYTDLVNASVEGAQDPDTTRAAYFAGDAAMIVWSSFLLDELAGLRDDALPTCPECEEDPLFLAENSGVVTAIQGPSGDEPSQFGEVVSFVISDTAQTEDAQRFVEFMMSDGYVDWLALAPEGKFPTRLGTADNPTEYADAWGELEAGVDRKQPLGEIYDAETIEALTTSSETMKRWAFTQGQGALAGALVTEVPVPTALGLALEGAVSPEEAAQEAQAAIEEILGALE